MKHREHTSNTLTKGAALLTLLSVLLVPFSSTNAYFHDKESSFENLFGASTLGIVLSVNESDANSRTVTVENDGESELVYSVRVEDVSSAPSFCADVQVKYDGGTEQTVLAALGDVTLPVGGSEVHTFEYIFDAGAHAGETCVLRYVYEARQDGYNYGEAFFDTEVDIVTLSGAEVVDEPDSPAVVINEVMPNQESSSTETFLGNEWIEIYNPTGAAIDLLNWVITEESGESGNEKEHTIQDSGATGEAYMHTGGEGTVVGPGGYLILFFNAGQKLNNKGDIIRLYNVSGALIDEVQYGNYNDQDDKGEAWVRIPDGSDTAEDHCTATPETSNSCASLASITTFASPLQMTNVIPPESGLTPASVEATEEPKKKEEEAPGNTGDDTKNPPVIDDIKKKPEDDDATDEETDVTEPTEPTE